MKFYQIAVYYTTPIADGWLRHGALPIFYLRDDIQGILDEASAEHVARRMLSELAPGATFDIGVGVSAEFAPSVIGA